MNAFAVNGYTPDQMESKKPVVAMSNMTFPEEGPALHMGIHMSPSEARELAKELRRAADKAEGKAP